MSSDCQDPAPSSGRTWFSQQPKEPRNSQNFTTRPTVLSHRPTDISEVPQLALQLERTKVTELSVEVGSQSFEFWFVVSSYLPIITACVSPITSMLSIAALVTRWRMTSDGTYLNDSPAMLAMNGTSLGLGLVANISLVMNYSRRLPYVVSQTISISLFFAASMILLAAVLVADHIYYGETGNMRTEGFWFAILTTIFYFLCSITCLANFSGFLLGKYPPDFNLEKSERGLIFYTFLLSVWFLWGSGMFSVLMDLTFGDAMYFCCVSLLTIGLGDIPPRSDSSKAMCLVFSFSGIIILGLIIAMIRSMISTMSAPVLFWNLVEERRRKVFDRVKRENIVLTPNESFDLIRSIRKEARIHRSRSSMVSSIGLFIAFWLIGALIFHFTEGWRYFDAVYFCFLCLITIGYGDFAPATPAGRPVFIVWSLAAVPLMTVLISAVGETVYDLAVSGTTGKILERVLSSSSRQLEDYEANRTALFEDRSAESLDDEEVMSTDEILEEAKHKDPRRQTIMKSRDLVKSLRKIMIESKNSPKKRYAFDEWTSVMQLLDYDLQTGPAGNDTTARDGWFWISESSPLRYPINEPDYLLYLLFSKLENNILERAAALENELRDSEVNADEFTTNDHHASGSDQQTSTTA